LTSATQLDPGAVYRARPGSALHADVEVALLISGDALCRPDEEITESAIAGYGAALELVDLTGPPDDPESIVAANVFHCAFALGPTHPRPPPEGAKGGLVVNGELRASAGAAQDFVGLLRSTAVLLDTVGERLQEGDRVITGSVVQLPVQAGDEVIADLGPLGRVHLTIAALTYR